MPKHEQYEELCTLAMMGEASAQEIKELKDHLDGCAECRQEYREFVQFLLPQLCLAGGGHGVEELNPSEREAIRSSFLSQAKRAGVRFSQEAVEGVGQSSEPQGILYKVRTVHLLSFHYALASALAVGLIAGAFVIGRRSAPSVAHLNAVITSPADRHVTPLKTAVVDWPANSSTTRSSVDESRIAELRQQLDDTTARLEKAQAALKAYGAERAEHQDELRGQSVRVAELQRDKQGAEDARAKLQEQFQQLQNKESAIEIDYTRQVASIVELTEKAKEQQAASERERQLLTNNSEVHDLMASRSLHIVDVFDTDTRGKTKPIFGRVFFAENKQLVFYAYDLNETQGRGTKIDYRIWGQKEGPGQSAKSLGVFYPDDKTQSRWVFKSDDQKVLSEIDSIFVTIEKSDSPKIEPKGQKLMYAYLRDHPNHP